MNLYEAERLAELVLKRDRLRHELNNFSLHITVRKAYKEATTIIHDEQIKLIKKAATPPEEIKDPIIEHSVGIGLGNGCSAGLSLNNELLINFFNHETRAVKQINFGYRTRAQVDELLGYIGHLKIHLPE